MVEAMALLVAARRKVVRGEGLERRFRGRRARLNVSKRKNVREGLRVRTSEAE